MFLKSIHRIVCFIIGVYNLCLFSSLKDEEEEDEELPPLPSFRRSTVMTSDYESSNDSPPSGSEEAGARLIRSHVAVQTSAWAGKGPCALCGRSLVLTPSPLAVARPITQQVNFVLLRFISLK